MVYFIREGDAGNIKIGFTLDDINKRVADLQTGCSQELIVLHLIDGESSKEREIHEQFSHLRIRGEWFRPDPELIEYIEELKRSGTVNEKMLNMSNQVQRLLAENERLKKKIEESKQYKLADCETGSSDLVFSDKERDLMLFDYTDHDDFGFKFKNMYGVISIGNDKELHKIEVYSDKNIECLSVNLTTKTNQCTNYIIDNNILGEKDYIDDVLEKHEIYMTEEFERNKNQVNPDKDHLAEIKSLRQQVEELKALIEPVEEMPTEFNGWQTQKQKNGFFRLWKVFPEIGLKWIYVGKTWNTEKMAAKIKKKEDYFTRELSE